MAPPLKSVELQQCSDFDPTHTTMAVGLTNESAIISYLCNVNQRFLLLECRRFEPERPDKLQGSYCNYLKKKTFLLVFSNAGNNFKIDCSLKIG